MAITLWSGLVLGSVYALVAAGFAIAMVPTGVFNFAQGAIVIGGSFLTYQFLTVTKIPEVLAVVLTVLVGMAAGLLCELLAVRPLRWGRGTVESSAMVTTVGASTALVGLLAIKWGDLPLQVPFLGPGGYLHFLGVVAQPVQITVVVLAVVSALALEAFFRYTRTGRVCLAVAEDRDAAMLRGVNVSVLSLAAFGLAGAFGAAAGMIIGPITYAEPVLGTTLALYGFVAVALGGEGSFIGGLIGGLVVGVVASLAIRYLGASYGDIAVLALLLVTLAVRPKGLGGFTKARSV
jgi:branched-chain amino acid transport system permease protein